MTRTLESLATAAKKQQESAYVVSLWEMVSIAFG